MGLDIVFTHFMKECLSILIVSNALLRSTKQVYKREDNLKALSISVFRVKIWSVRRQCFRKPICSEPIMLLSSKYLSSLLKSILQNSLLKQLEIAIPL